MPVLQPEPSYLNVLYLDMSEERQGYRKWQTSHRRDLELIYCHSPMWEWITLDPLKPEE